MSRNETLIRGATVVCMDASRRVARLDVLVRDGLIAQTSPTADSGDAPKAGKTGGDASSAAKIVDASGLVLIPGLVHSHLHLCQVLFRNSAEDLELLPWLSERIWPLEAAHNPDSLRASAELGIAELLKSGATAVLDMGTVRHHDAVFEAARDAGIRLVSGKAMMDLGESLPSGLQESTRQSLDESDRLHSTWDGAAKGRLRYAYAPRFVPSCSDTLLAELAARVEQGAALHTHASENLDEVQLVRRMTGKGNIEYLHNLGLLSPRTTLAHCVHLDPGDPELLSRTHSSVAHCPSANLKLASGIADLVELRAAGVNVGLGADGAPCNNNLDIWREMKLAGLLPRLKHGPTAFAAEQVFELATLGGARALGQEQSIGSIEVGKKADLVLVDLSGAHAQPPGESIYTQLVYAAQASDVREVWVEGELLVSQGKLLSMDEREVVQRAREQSRKTRERAGLPV